MFQTWKRRCAAPLLILSLLAGCVARSDSAGRGMAYLAREVPAWWRDHQCFSCHNNGDGARALYVAMQRSREVVPSALSVTTLWLSRPNVWDENKGDPAFNDKNLARLQFATALAAAVRAGQIIDQGARIEAIESLLELQAPGGEFVVEPRDVLGAPATWGTPLATAMAMESLLTLVPPQRNRPEATDRAQAWLLKLQPRSVLDAAAALIGTGGIGQPHRAGQTSPHLDLIRRSRSPDGGWGPYPNAAPEPFDTAVVLVALARIPPTPETLDWIQGARSFLAAVQLDDGSWPETTRPRGAESYAQRVSTTAWVTQALLETENIVKENPAHRLGLNEPANPR